MRIVVKSFAYRKSWTLPKTDVPHYDYSILVLYSRMYTVFLFIII